MLRRYFLENLETGEMTPTPYLLPNEITKHGGSLKSTNWYFCSTATAFLRIRREDFQVRNRNVVTGIRLKVLIK